MPEIPLIVGAGPVGLAAALFLAQHKTPVRIIDKNRARSVHSKALAVNPRTLELLQSTGVTDRMLAIGKRIDGGMFWGQGRPVADVSFDMAHKFPFMLALAQASSERLLEEALIEAGGVVERGSELVACRSLIGQAEATIKRAEDAQPQIVNTPWIFAADGARSTVRHLLQIDFKGSSLPTPWSLVDVPMEIDLPEDKAHILFLARGGFLFVMRVVSDEQTSLPLWRVMGDVPDPMARLAELRTLRADPPVWTSSFHVGHRLASKLQVDKICLGGDAAHIHSPAGARGMNLGVEDAWEFSWRVLRGMLAGYSKSRSAIDGAVVKRVSRITQMAEGGSVAARIARSIILPLGSDVGFIRRRVLRTIGGIDHDIDANAMRINGHH